MLCAPPVRGVVGVKLQLPPVTVAVPIRVATPPTVSYTLTLATSALAPVPETVGVLSSVTLLVVLVIAPTTAPTLSVMATVPKPAEAGPVVSTVMTTGVLGLLVLPAGSVAVVVML